MNLFPHRRTSESFEQSLANKSVRTIARRNSTDAALETHARTRLSKRRRIVQQDTARIKTILASYYGIVTGRGLFNIASYVGDVIRGDKAKVASEKVLTKAMLDPEFALLMLKADTRQNQIAARTYILNNFPEILEGEDSE